MFFSQNIYIKEEVTVPENKFIVTVKNSTEQRLIVNLTWDIDYVSTDIGIAWSLTNNTPTVNDNKATPVLLGGETLGKSNNKDITIIHGTINNYAILYYRAYAHLMGSIYEYGDVQTLTVPISYITLSNFNSNNNSITTSWSVSDTRPSGDIIETGLLYKFYPDSSWVASYSTNMIINGDCEKYSASAPPIVLSTILNIPNMPAGNTVDIQHSVYCRAYMKIGTTVYYSRIQIYPVVVS